MLMSGMIDDARSYDSNPLIAPMEGNGPKIAAKIETPTSQRSQNYQQSTSTSINRDWFLDHEEYDLNLYESK